MINKLILFLLFIFSCIRSFGIFNLKVDSIIVYSLKWDAIYCPPVSCADFFSYTNGENSCTIKDDKVIKDINSHLRNLERSRVKNISVKSKMYFYCADSVIYTACIGSDGILLNGIFYKRSDYLANLIANLDYTKKNVKYKRAHSYNTIERGEKMLFKKLKEIQNRIEGKKSILLKGSCHADNIGNTVKINFLAYVNNETISPKDIHKIEKIFIAYIKWNRNKERMITDLIPIYILMDKKVITINIYNHPT